MTDYEQDIEVTLEWLEDRDHDPARHLAAEFRALRLVAYEAGRFAFICEAEGRDAGASELKAALAELLRVRREAGGDDD